MGATLALIAGDFNYINTAFTNTVIVFVNPASTYTVIPSSIPLQLTR